MKKILTASLVAMMAVTAANADIASTEYVTDRTGDLQFTNSEIIGESGNLTAAVNAVATKVAGLSADMGTGGAVSEQIGSAIGGLDSTQNGDGTVVKSVSQTDGKVSVTFGTIANADVAAGADIAQSKIANLTTDLAAKQTKDNIVSLDASNQLPATVDNPNEKYPSYSATEKMIGDEIGVLTEGVSDQIDAINVLVDKKADKTTTLAGYGITNAYTKTETDSAITTKVETLDADVAATANNVIVGIKEVDGKLTEVTSAQITNDYIASNAAIAKTKLATDVQNSLSAADTAMQWAALKNDASWTAAGCNGAGVICSLVAKDGNISWEKVVNE